MKGKGNDLLSRESIENIGRATKHFVKRVQSEGIDLNFYTIPQVIEDIETARKAWGYNILNLRSASYGTRVALLYKYLYPQHIHRSVMEAINPPGGFVWETDVLERH